MSRKHFRKTKGRKNRSMRRGGASTSKLTEEQETHLSNFITQNLEDYEERMGAAGQCRLTPLEKFRRAAKKDPELPETVNKCEEYKMANYALGALGIEPDFEKADTHTRRINGDYKDLKDYLEKNKETTNRGEGFGPPKPDVPVPPTIENDFPDELEKDKKIENCPSYGKIPVLPEYAKPLQYKKEALKFSQDKNIGCWESASKKMKYLNELEEIRQWVQDNVSKGGGKRKSKRRSNNKRKKTRRR